MALFLGAMAHLGLRLGGSARRLGRLAVARAFDSDEPLPIGADGRVEPLFDARHGRTAAH